MIFKKKILLFVRSHSINIFLTFLLRVVTFLISLSLSLSLNFLLTFVIFLIFFLVVSKVHIFTVQYFTFTLHNPVND